METILGLIMGIGLSAACGFRVFVPLLGLSIATHAGYIHPAPAFAWIGSWPAVTAFATATVLEIGAYYIPWLDHLLDYIATPVAIAAGTVVTASLVTDLPPLVTWSLAAIVGGGTAGVVQAGTMALRAGSLAATGGLGNIFVAKGELFASLVGTILSIVLPLLALGMVIVILAVIGYGLTHGRKKESHP